MEPRPHNESGHEPPQGPRPAMGAGRIAAVLLVAFAFGGLVYYLAAQFPDALSESGSAPYLVYLVIFGSVVAASVIMGREFRWARALKALSIWLGIGLALVVGYSFRGEIAGVKDRVVSEVSPTTPVRTAIDTLTFRAATDGHYYINADLNGRPVRLLVDTGATTTVLSRNDADRVGINLSALDYRYTIRTANGNVRGARTELRDLRVGPAELRDVKVLVIDSPLRTSVIGISTLRRFKGYEVRDNVLTLRW